MAKIAIIKAQQQISIEVVGWIIERMAENATINISFKSNQIKPNQVKIKTKTFFIGENCCDSVKHYILIRVTSYFIDM